MEGLSATQTRDMILSTNELGVSLSRQAVENIYLRLGNYLWTHFVKVKMLSKFKEYGFEREISPELFLVIYLDTMRKSIEGNIDYQYFREDGVEIGSMGTTKILIDRSKRFNGLSPKHFHCHFAYASYIDTMQTAIDEGEMSFDDVKISLIKQFEKMPL